MSSHVPPSVPAAFGPPAIEPEPAPPAWHVVVAMVALAAVAALAWFAWLGWDDEYYLVNGVEHGPYRPWQVIAAGLTVIGATLLAYLRTQGVAAALSLPFAAAIGFTVPWTVHASSTDETGLYFIGTLMLLFGITTVLAGMLGVVALIVSGIRASRASGN